MNQTADYDLRYLAGVLFFNDGDYFEAHEVWEDLWSESAGADRKFYQGLIQAAVGLCHFCNRNTRGAVKLFGTSRAYMEGLPSRHLGMDLDAFWVQMERCFAPILTQTQPIHQEPDESLLPVIQLEPAPASWPDRSEYHSSEEET